MAGASDYIISNAEINNVHVQGRPDILQGSAQQNKKAFDDYPDLITARHNGLCAYVDTEMSTTIDREVLELYQSLGWIPDND